MTKAITQSAFEAAVGRWVMLSDKARKDIVAKHGWIDQAGIRHDSVVVGLEGGALAGFDVHGVYIDDGEDYTYLVVL